MKLKVRRREKLNDALLDEQDAQWQSGVFHADDEVLRAISIEITSYDTKRAIMLAAQDEAEVKAMRRMDAATGMQYTPGMLCWDSASYVVIERDM